jgi:hypothetical protein
LAPRRAHTPLATRRYKSDLPTRNRLRGNASLANPLTSRFADLAARSDRPNGRINTATWMVGTSMTLTLLVLDKLLFAHA